MSWLGRGCSFSEGAKNAVVDSRGSFCGARPGELQRTFPAALFPQDLSKLFISQNPLDPPNHRIKIVRIEEHRRVARRRNRDPNPPTTRRTASAQNGFGPGPGRHAGLRHPAGLRSERLRPSTPNIPVPQLPRCPDVHRGAEWPGHLHGGRLRAGRFRCAWLPPGWLPAGPVRPGPVRPGPLRPGSLRPGRGTASRASSSRPVRVTTMTTSPPAGRAVAVALGPAAFWPRVTAAARRGADGPVPGRGRRRRGRDRVPRHPADQERREQGGHRLVHAEHRHHRGRRRDGTNGYVFTQAAKVGTSFPLNKTATKAFTPTLVNHVGSRSPARSRPGDTASRARSRSASTT